MNDIELIQNKIYEIRGQRVMLDRDLAYLYGVETKVLNQAVKRNPQRFPPDFMFQLSENELTILRSQIVTSKGRGGVRYLPYAFTELGVAMLSSVLKSETAIEVNIGIMRAFVELRQLASSLPKPDITTDVSKLRQDFEDLKLDIEDILRNQNDINEDTQKQLDAISTALAELQAKPKEEKPRRRIGFIQDEK
jgi:hypothetical protein